MSEISVAVVDDDRSLQQALVCLLEASNFAATGFDSAEAFLGSTHFNTTDCLITDIQMSGMNGFELKEAITLRRRTFPVIIMTALQMSSGLLPADAADPVCILSKPFESEQLLECLERVFSRS